MNFAQQIYQDQYQYLKIRASIDASAGPSVVKIETSWKDVSIEPKYIYVPISNLRAIVEAWDARQENLQRTADEYAAFWSPYNEDYELSQI